MFSQHTQLDLSCALTAANGVLTLAPLSGRRTSKNCFRGLALLAASSRYRLACMFSLTLAIFLVSVRSCSAARAGECQRPRCRVLIVHLMSIAIFSLRLSVL